MKTLFQCEICGAIFQTEKGALDCEAVSMEKPQFNIGDIVTISKEFGWQDGDEKWNASTKKDGCDKIFLTFFYVVTAITPKENNHHKICYHIFTGAMRGEHGHQSGQTTSDTHHPMKLVKHPPDFVKEDSKQFIGRTSDVKKEEGK